MNTYLAHSAGETTPAQSYEEHVTRVVESSTRFAETAEVYNTQNDKSLSGVVSIASEYHDLGKLACENQKVLHIGDQNKRLPVNHVDAGAVHCFRHSEHSGLTVYSHHRGLPNFSEEELREENAFRDDDKKTRKYVDDNLNEWLKIHHSLRPSYMLHKPETYSGDVSVFQRLALSCLADADHSDTAKVYGNGMDLEASPELMAAQRLAALDAYVAGLGVNSDTQRNALRSQMFEICRNADVKSSVISCSSPVGTGKTTAVMAHLLHQAQKNGARHVFVVLPYTNIIMQSVEVYRKALTLPGEDPETVVAELHHKADYDSVQNRHLSALWRAPIIVTTAVAFFETMAANKPAALRRLHELPGSVIFVDEAHAALPVYLLPIAWRWMQIFADEWGCHWVLASGSLVKFWSIHEISEETRSVPELVSEQFRIQLAQFENSRVSYKFIPNPISRSELAELIAEQPGPRLLIVNTVKTAAVLANDLKARFGKEKVIHLSTALSPADRQKTLACIKERLNSQTEDNDWTLVATSCVEAGMEFSFKTGFREMGSLLSLLQTAGRINRDGKEQNAPVYSFDFQDDGLLTRNPGVEHSAKILRRYHEKGKLITPDLSTNAIQRELEEYGTKSMDLVADEEALEFEAVARKFRVIDSDTVLAVVNHGVVARLRCGHADWKELQKHAVSVRRNKIQQYHLEEIVKDVYAWTLPYDSFLGIMSGIFAEKTAKEDFLCI